MKKHSTLFLLYFFAQTIIKGQITLTNSNTVFSSGQTIAFNKTNYQTPGSSGINQIWDYSLITPISSFSLSIKTTTNTNYIYPSASNFTIVDSINNKTYYYSFSNDSSITSLDDEFANNCQNNYHLMFPFPFNYGDSVSKSINPCYVINGCASGLSGGNQTYKAKFDAYGTLILPSGTFTNCARIKYISSMPIQCGASFVGIATATVYSYYVPNINYPIAKSIDKYQPRPYNPPTTTQEFYYQSSINVGLSENNFQSLISIYPNPANEYLYLKLNNYQKGINYIIKDIYGKSLLYSLSKINNNDLNAKIDISMLQSGTYFIEINDSENFITKKIIVLK